MQIVNLLGDTIAPLLAADTTYLANATAMKVSLITAPFSQGIGNLIGDLTLDSSAPLAAIAAVAGAQQTGKDPITGKWKITIKPPSGGFRWNTGVSFAAPVTVYGFALTNGGITTLLGTETLATPVPLNADNQELVAPELSFPIDTNKIF